MATDKPDQTGVIYRGPYILMTVDGTYQFVPARKDERLGWVPLTAEEYEEAKYRAAH